MAGPFERKLHSQLLVVDAATGEKRLLGKDDAVQPSWSPNGRRIAYWGVPAGTATPSITRGNRCGKRSSPPALAPRHP